jgi:hypothetical protein
MDFSETASYFNAKKVAEILKEILDFLGEIVKPITAL